jgi:Domain of unknown function (DUF4258)
MKSYCPGFGHKPAKIRTVRDFIYLGRMKKAAWLLALLVAILLIYRWQGGGETREAGGERIEKRGERREAGGERIEKRDERREAGGDNDPAAVDRRGGLNRNATTLIYSKHARCRMDCRHISETEVVDVLRKGHINYSKSDMRGQPDPKYAIEGVTEEGQEVRIVFANSPRGIVVVTVIDLENEWKCNCK